MKATSHALQDDLEAMAATLARSGRFRVVRRLEPVSCYGEPTSATGMVASVDVEVDRLGEDARVTQIGVVAAEYSASTGEVGRVLKRYSGKQDPRRELHPDMQALTGQSWATLRNKKIDIDQVAEILGGADIVIAHQASHDRRVLQKLLPGVAKLNWACTLKDVDWNSERISGRSLEVIALQYGAFYRAHDAMEDAEATLFVASRRSLNEGFVLRQCLMASRLREAALRPTGAAEDAETYGSGRPRAQQG